MKPLFRSRRSRLAFAVMSALLGSCAAVAGAQTAPAQSAQTYSNPVLNTVFADPAAMRDGETLYAYATGLIGGGYFPVSSSTDLVHWTKPTPALTTKPSWAAGTGFWAPTVIPDPHQSGPAKRYLMYYSAITSDPQYHRGHCIGVAESTSPLGPFHELKQMDGVTPRLPLACGLSYRNIDPAPFHDTNPASASYGKWFLFWGSGQGQPVLRKQLSSADITQWEEPSATPTPVLTAGAAGTYQHLREGAYVIFRTKGFTRADADFYYIFTSGFNCCPGPGVENDYAVSVVRSKSLDGPWEVYSGPAGSGDAILHFNGTWGNPGGNEIFKDGAGNDWIIYHARAASGGPRVLLIDPITYIDGWPRVNPDPTKVNGETPDSPSITGQHRPVAHFTR